MLFIPVIQAVPQTTIFPSRHWMQVTEDFGTILTFFS